MTKLTVFSNKGTKLKEIEPTIVKSEANLAAVAQAVRVYTHNLHTGLSKVKTRSEVKISTRKIYRQKGTGNARHGAKSAPIFVGGGIAHGPKGLKRAVTLSKNIKEIALKSAFSLKARENSVAVIEGLVDFKKTADVVRLLNKVKKEMGIQSDLRMTIVVPIESRISAIRNIKNTMVCSVNSLNALKVANGGLILIDAGAIEYFERGNKKPEKVVESKKGEAKEVAKKVVTTKKVVKPAAKKISKGGKK